MNKIKYGQFTAILLISDIFALLCYSERVTLLTGLSFIIATAMQYLIILPAIKYGKCDDSKIILWTCFIVSVLWGALLFVKLWDIADVISIPMLNEDSIITQRIMIASLIALVCLYCASSGIKALSRVAVLLTGFGALCFIIIILGSIDVIEVKNLKIKGDIGIINQIINGFSMAGSLTTLIYLSKRLDGKVIKTTTFYFIIRSIFLAISTVLIMLTVGGIMDIIKFPVIRSAQLSQPFSSQRMDAVFIIIIVLFAIVAISAQTVISAEIITELIPKIKHYKSTIILVIMLIVAYFISNINRYNIIYSIIFIIPLIITIILGTINKRKGLKKCEE